MKTNKIAITYILSLLILFLLLILFCLLPKQEFSQLENRYLEKKPKLNISNLFSGNYTSVLENYITDHFPYRENFVLTNGIIECFLNKSEKNGVVLGKNNWIFEGDYAINTKLLNNNIDALNSFTKAINKEISIIVVPSSYEIYSDYLPNNYPLKYHYEYIKNQINNVNFIDLKPQLLKQSRHQQLYFKSDHHWNAYGAEIAYSTLKNIWNLQGNNTAKLKTLNGFLGSLYAKAIKAFYAPEEFNYWDNNSIALSISNKDYEGLHDLNKLKQRDKHSALLYGNHAISTLTNKNASGRILLVKDSSANELLPLLASSFNEIVSVDLRYFDKDIYNFIENNNFDKILFLYTERSILNENTLYLKLNIPEEKTND